MRSSSACHKLAGKEPDHLEAPYTAVIINPLVLCSPCKTGWRVSMLRLICEAALICVHFARPFLTTRFDHTKDWARGNFRMCVCLSGHASLVEEKGDKYHQSIAPIGTPVIVQPMSIGTQSDIKAYFQLTSTAGRIISPLLLIESHDSL